MNASLDLSGVGIKPPDVPSKYDIIPIHTSDRGTFKACRRRWGWSSPAQRNLVPKVALNGVYIPFWFGTGIHYALEKYYNPTLNEDPVVVWETWFDLQWNGGIVTADQIHTMGLEDRLPERTGKGDLYVVKGLEELLPDPRIDEFQMHKELGTGMMKYYKNWCQEKDNFRVIMVEHTFSVPLLDPTGQPMYAADNREMPIDWEPDWTKENMYGPLMQPAYAQSGPEAVLKQVHARGRMDNIIQEQENGQFGIIDYKTASRVDDDYFRHLDLDEQCTTYLWAGEREAVMHGLEYASLSFIYYQAMLKAYPKPPTILKSGLPSIGRSTESTTAAMFAQVIEILNLQRYFETDEKMQAYYTYLVDTEDTRFINRKLVRRNKAQKASCGSRLYYEATEMLTPNLPLYPNPTKTYPCLNCQFRTPCIMVEDGSDYEVVLRDGYQKNWDR